MASSLAVPRHPASFPMLLACGAYRSRTCADLLCSVLGYGPGSCECMREYTQVRLRLGRQAGRQAGSRQAGKQAGRQAGRQQEGPLTPEDPKEHDKPDLSHF